MKLFQKPLLFITLTSVLFSCSPEEEITTIEESDNTSLALRSRITELYGSLTPLTLPLSSDYSGLPQDANNPITEAKVILGKFLFHETGLALNPVLETGKNTYSCASCHHSAAGFQSGNPQGIGEGGFGYGNHGEMRVVAPEYTDDLIDIQPIKSPTILNSAYQEVMLWNGQFGGLGMNTGTEASWTTGTPKAVNTLGFEGVETQAIAGLDVHRLVIDNDYVENTAYKDLFDQAFPEVEAANRYSKVNAGLAIAAYERTVIANKAPFQKWLKGQTDAMTKEQMQGAQLFFGKAQCYQCHNGPALNDMNFYALGMLDLAGEGTHGTVDEATKKGRGGFTNREDDNYKFKTPTLYNLKDTEVYGHGSSFKTVREVIAYKNNAIPENSNVPESQLSRLFTSLNLTEEEIDLIVTFLEEGLHDDSLYRYTPISLPTGNCFPNADSQSKSDMGCN